jgi:hypothetical protein
MEALPNRHIDLGRIERKRNHLSHNSPAMTLRYLSTLTQEDALRVQQEVEFKE